ncbi:hypothetical protein AAFF_G00244790, partial [Aldrovandia affinis]
GSRGSSRSSSQAPGWSQPNKPGRAYSFSPDDHRAEYNLKHGGQLIQHADRPAISSLQATQFGSEVWSRTTHARSRSALTLPSQGAQAQRSA